MEKLYETAHLTLQPSKVFVIELAQAVKVKKEIVHPGGVLIYTVDAKLKTGHNPVVVYPKTDTKDAPFHEGDSFNHEDAPFQLKVLSKNSDGSYTVEIELKSQESITAQIRD